MHLFGCQQRTADVRELLYPDVIAMVMFGAGGGRGRQVGGAGRVDRRDDGVSATYRYEK